MLTAAEVQKAKPGPKARKLFDEKGLFLLVTPPGGKLWRLKYRIHGREKVLALGAYPDVSLADARDRRDAARKDVAAGDDPSAKRRAQKLARGNTFEVIAREWHARFRSKWTAETAETKLRRLEMHAFPQIGKKPISTVTSADVLSLLRRIEARETYDTARRVRQLCSEVMRYAVSTGRAENDPTGALRGALAPVQTTHRAAPTDPKAIGSLLRMIDAYDGTPAVKAALRLGPLVFVRPGELRRAEWTEIDLDRAEWTIPAFKMKMRQTLTVPLSRQAVDVLRGIRPITGDGKYVFPSGRAGQRPMSDNAVLAAMRRMGIAKEEMSGHGWRAIARTLLDEVLRFRVDLIEHQLGHAVKDPNGRAYNRTSFLAERTEMMQVWADYLDALKKEYQAAARSR
jgi:integrase